MTLHYVLWIGIACAVTVSCQDNTTAAIATPASASTNIPLIIPVLTPVKAPVTTFCDEESFFVGKFFSSPADCQKNMWDAYIAEGQIRFPNPGLITTCYSYC